MTWATSPPPGHRDAFADLGAPVGALGTPLFNFNIVK
jgi:hypothetical protein